MAAVTLLPAGPSAKTLYKQGQKAERSGDVLRAYLLYAQAAALDPKQPKYWQRSEALRTKAAVKANARPADIKVPSVEPPPKPALTDLLGPSDDSNSGFSTGISAEDLEDVRRMRPPPMLAADPARKDIDLRGDAKSLFQQTAKLFRLDTIFDPEYPPGQPLRLQLQGAGYREALRALEAMTGSFAFPLNSHFIMVAKDTQQKRNEFEPVIAVTVPVPSAGSPQEFTELAQSVRQTMEIGKLSFDADRHMVLIKDRISRVIPAQQLFEQLAYDKPMVDIELQFMEVDRSATMSYGFLLPSQFPLFWLGPQSMIGVVQNMAKFLFGPQVIGVAIANAQLFATMTDSSSHILMDADSRTLEGSAAVFHVGDQYPILTGGFIGDNLGFPPSFTFEKLGLSMKVTPRVHGAEDISLELQSEFKMLSGQSINGIPVISNRSLDTNVRLKNGQWAVVGGLMSVQEARAITGVAGLSNLPLIGRLFRRNDKTDSSREILLLIKPRLLTLPPEEFLTRAIYAGANMRLQIPL